MARELVISFLYGEFNAALVDGATVVERWSPSASDRAHGFHEAAFRFFLESVVEHFDYAGKEAVLVVADVEMEHHQVALPPVNKQQRQQLLRLEAEKLAEGRSLAWSYLRIGSSVGRRSGAVVATGSDQYLLHCWPLAKLNSYLADFAHVGVAPRLILPDVALFHAWTDEAGLGKEATALVYTGENGTTVMLSDPQATKLFVRRLSPAIGHSKERLPGEIRRSLQYARQDMGLRPELLVTNDQQLAVDLQAQLDRDVVIEVEISWADQPVLAHYSDVFSRRESQSFVPNEIRYAKYNRLINRVVVAAIAITVITSVIVAASVEWSLRGETLSFDKLAASYELRVQEQQSLQREIDDIRGEQAFAEGARLDKQKLTYWLLRDLGDELPKTLRLSGLNLAYGDESTITLSAEVTAVIDNMQRLDSDMQVFGEKLAAEPWLVNWPVDWVQQWRDQYMGGNRGQQLEIEFSGELPG